jgi:hypothetical protein
MFESLVIINIFNKNVACLTVFTLFVILSLLFLPISFGLIRRFITKDANL